MKWMNKIIEVINLQKSYDTFKVVKGIDFYVEEGNLFALLGANGAGKSTTIDILCTLLNYDSGEVIIDGHKLGVEDNKIKEKIGVVFQESILDPLLTVRENLTIRAKFYIKNKDKVRQIVHESALSVGAMEFIDRPYGKLSGGQKRRADIARALLNTPKILFLDEPTTGLDPEARKCVWDTILKLQKQYGFSIVLTTHYMEEASKADYIVMLDYGVITAKGSPHELKYKYKANNLDDVFLNIVRNRGEKNV
ncbi:ATP-binding cassette domain-containing protein [Clostridioides sp. ZZV15-6598]|uniref:ABC transporter ATP-binding protein n=1 Tax=Clostridioides sp. ZZV15-6598 TaxID=2811501 RepID=UPI001D0F8601